MLSEAPIFIVGSPRSGTSILCWCLGQHPNILLLEETNWFSTLALALQLCHLQGTARGYRSQLSSMGITRDQLFQVVGEAIRAMISGQRSAYEAESAHIAELEAKSVNRAFLLSRNALDPKRRWVDGTPEYSLSVFGLHTLFPEAKFIHIVRDVRSVVKSLILFSKVAGFSQVRTEQDAYKYWLRTTQSCVAAERALGSGVVLRVLFRDLIASPEDTLQRCLHFVGESYHPDCLLPLADRINSSNVPEGYDPTDAQTDPALRDEAHRLSEELYSGDMPNFLGSHELLTELETKFVNQARYEGWAGTELFRGIAAERTTMTTK